MKILKEHHGHWRRRMGEKNAVKTDPGYFDEPCPGSGQSASPMPDNPIDPWLTDGSQSRSDDDGTPADRDDPRGE